VKLDKKPVPLYFQLEKVLRKRILSGKTPFDHPLPTEKELGQEFGVSRITVRQALKALEDDQLIRREQGRGTFVSFRRDRPFQFRLYGKVDDLFHLGGHTSLKLQAKRLITPPADITQDMRLSPEEKVYLFEGIRHLYDGHDAFFLAYVPEAIGRNIDLKEPGGPLLIERVEREALETVKRSQQIISASIADRELAAILKNQKRASLAGYQEGLFFPVRPGPGNGRLPFPRRCLPGGDRTGPRELNCLEETI
jgi:GntR family transcriptional regulator